MKKHLTLLALLGALFATAGITAAHAQPDTKPAAKKKVVKKAHTSKAHGKKAAAAAAPAAKMPFSSDAEDDDSEPDLGGTVSADFQCEMGQKLTIWKNEADDKHIAIRWNKRIHRLTRVATTTGANRFENHKMGLVWIGIPAKGLLLDSKKGQQLANECKNAEQMKAAAAAPAALLAAAPHQN
ncbi:hypothetical protein GWL_23220 [Herbaspirillum sp. GW103]|jgi:hypothetical protein|uniref:hypothetical protein n=1 Tax=unclassified Herbaspirillum TaxID=2624150 RepID=UPI00025E2AD7|nr:MULTISPECIES: hypothetical protein [unclassified Herbaspirillum]EIJ48080.1 hypothetical protein GWL_23220 [Herbaspirillum sp. GW103]MCI1005632.1 hypothetical protein [Herbaspirillum sp. C7C8]NUT62511.1 hypothetical protein [Herbaspirillum sp. C9C3]